ncbi:MAG: methionyl-tRNA formyltransferase [bacterium]
MKILLFGITDFCTNILDKLVQAKYDVCGLVVNASNNIDVQEMKTLAQAAKIRCFEPAKVKDPVFIAEIKKSCQPDVILVFTYDQLIPAQLYSLAKIAAINMHPSALPKYRGCHPYFWPIANGEKYTALTYHYLTDQFDTGDIIAQETIAIEPSDTSGIVIEKQKQLSWEMLRSILLEIAKTQKAPAATPQPTGDFIGAPRVKLPDYFVDWAWPNKKILDRIRALNPFSAAFTIYKGVHLGVYQVEVVETTAQALPGTIIELREMGPVVKTRDGALLLRIIVVGRKYLLSGDEFIKREGVKVNENFSYWR